MIRVRCNSKRALKCLACSWSCGLSLIELRLILDKRIVFFSYVIKNCQRHQVKNLVGKPVKFSFSYSWKLSLKYKSDIFNVWFNPTSFHSYMGLKDLSRRTPKILENSGKHILSIILAQSKSLPNMVQFWQPEKSTEEHFQKFPFVVPQSVECP